MPSLPDDMGNPECNCFDKKSLLGLTMLAWAGTGWQGSPKRTVLGMIGWYQANISAGRNLCSRPAGYNCSAFAVWAINSYGLVLGVILAGLRMSQPCKMGEHRAPRDARWAVCVDMFSIIPLVTLGECDDRKPPPPEQRGACCDFFDCQ